MDVAVGIDDRHCMRLLRLFNETEGKKYLLSRGIDRDTVNRLELLGISGIANLIGAVKTARYFEMNETDFIFTIATDSMELYQSRLDESRKKQGAYTEIHAAADFESCLLAQSIDHMLELSYWNKKRMHNLKYFTWVEQMGRDADELERQWHDDSYWREKFQAHKEWDNLIREFNRKTGLLEIHN
jgi:hypothetical protein